VAATAVAAERAADRLRPAAHPLVGEEVVAVEGEVELHAARLDVDVEVDVVDAVDVAATFDPRPLVSGAEGRGRRGEPGRDE
jgi:hypothetical protein